MRTIKVTIEKETRLNKYLADIGVASRRGADKMIEENKVTVNNKKVTLGQKVKDGDTIKIKEESKEYIYALYNKPRGEVTGRLSELPSCEPLGRLDKESEGLLLYTNDYRVNEKLLHPRFAREKEYEVSIREKATPRVITLLKKGIWTQEAIYAPVRDIQIVNEGRHLRIVLTEGKKHEIRRMLNALNLTVLSLKRVRIGSFTVRGLKSGDIHYLLPRQKETLLKELDLANS